MIVMIRGILESVESGHALVTPTGGMTYEVLVSSWTGARLGNALGQQIELHTLHYIEGQNSGSTSYPRLAGFLSRQDKRFFELFTSVNGIGYRTALAAMALSSDRIARAISERDAALLQGLPKIGKRTAETIIATLHGKVETFLDPNAADDEAQPAEQGAAPAAAKGKSGKTKAKSQAGAATPDPQAAAKAAKRREIARDALDLLSGLGENRAQAMLWIDAVLEEDADLVEQSELIARALAKRESGR